MIKVVIFGTGNVAKHLFDALLVPKNVSIIQVIGRNKDAIQYFSSHTNTSTDLNTILDADVYIIAVSDPAIGIISEKLKTKKGLVVHTAGSVPMEFISEHDDYGVFYPLQTFTKGLKLDFKKIPFCLEASNNNNLDLLKTLANSVSDKIYEISSQQRNTLHICAIFINNFSNYMYHIANMMCEDNKIPFDILKTLIHETSNKIEHVSPFDAQTGPARRNDVATVNKHINQLENEDYKKIYSLLSEMILKTYGKEL